MSEPFEPEPHGIKKKTEEWIPHPPRVRNIAGWRGKVCIDCGLHVEVHVADPPRATEPYYTGTGQP